MPNKLKNYAGIEDITPEEDVLTFLSILFWYKKYGSRGINLLSDNFFLNKDVIEISNRFCQQCGSCCPTDCLALEERDGKSYCALHYNEGPREDFYPTEELDVTKAKPWECEACGPGYFYVSEGSHPCVQLLSQAIHKLKKQLLDYETVSGLMNC
jgi:ribosomal protein S27AE